MTDPANPQLPKLILVVLYRTEIMTADTVRSLLHCRQYISDKDKIFVWDNSPESQPPQVLEYLKTQITCEFEYRHTPENRALSKIYNAVQCGNSQYDFLLLFDQDSTFMEDYFTALQSAAAAHPNIDVFVPLIRSGQAIVSPGSFFYFKGRYWHEPKYGVVSSKNTVAITSGMAIRMSYLNSWDGFDERLQLYGIDTNFMLRYVQHKPAFYVMNVHFGHQLSDFDATENRSGKRKRFEDFRRASIINAQLFPLPVRILTRLFLLYKTIRF